MASPLRFSISTWPMKQSRPRGTDGDSPAAVETAPEAKDEGGKLPHTLGQTGIATGAIPALAGAGAPSVRQQLLAACQAAERWLQGPHDECEPDAILEMLRAAIGRAEGGQRREPGTLRQPRANSKEAQVIALLCRPQGATLAQIGAHTGWRTHTIRGFFAGALKKRRGLQMSSEKPEGGERTYRIAGGGC